MDRRGDDWLRMSVSSLLPQRQSMEGGLLQTSAQAELLATCLEDYWMAMCSGDGGAPCRCIGTRVVVGVERDGGGPFGLARC